MKRKASDEDIFSDKKWSSLQRRVLTSVLQKGQNVFMTGAGGVGKSECIKQIVKILGERGLKAAVLAHTGIAALTINGQTLWSFMHFNFERLKQSKEEIAAEFLKKKFWCEGFRSYRTMIIDEISMVDPEIFEIMDYVLQMVRRDYRPFGGMQVVLVGDFFQLPPPTEKKLTVRKYVFQSDVFWKAIDEMHDLQEMWRQRDPAFVGLLHRARRGNQTSDDIKVLHDRIGAKLSCEAEGISPTKLYALNEDVDSINKGELFKLQADSRLFPIRFGVYKGPPTKYKPKFDGGEAAVIKLLQDVGGVGFVPQNTALKDIQVKDAEYKVGAQVMLSYNLDVSAGLVNGSRGVIVGWTKDEDDNEEEAFALKSESHTLFYGIHPIVKFACGRTVPVPYVRYTLERDGSQAYLWRIALKLAWATSIHKSQSLTLDAAEVDLSNCFAAGMAYVALSRVKSLDSLRVASAFQASSFKIDADVVSFYDTPFLVQKALYQIPKSQKPAETLDFELI